MVELSRVVTLPHALRVGHSPPARELERQFHEPRALRYAPRVSWARAYRSMRADDTGLRPRCGEQSAILGVRPGRDVEVAPDGVVQCGSRPGGISVAPTPDQLPLPFRPVGLHAGQSRIPCWCLEVRSLSVDSQLGVFETSADHGVVGPVRAMPIDELQARLCNTAELWTRWRSEGTS